MKLEALEVEARACVEAVLDDPWGRLRLRESFYERYGFGPDRAVLPHGYGSSELDFLRWEIRRGVLNRVEDPVKGGSAWWRAVNARFLLDGEVAWRVYEAGLPEEGLSSPVRQWLRYLRSPSPETWYRAHNTSIGWGYLECVEEARAESGPELRFMNMVLYRVLFAQAMVEREPWALGHLGEVVANPGLPAVHLMVALPDFYPKDYPLTREDIEKLECLGHDPQDAAVDLFDTLILAHLDKMYHCAAKWNECPGLERLARDGVPVYGEEGERGQSPEPTVLQRLLGRVGLVSGVLSRWSGRALRRWFRR